jgi:NitT/TauT family transport system substrate-binding protein
LIGGGAGVPVVQMVATGRADFGTIGADELLTARAHGADVVAVFATFQTSPQGIMVHASRHLTGIAEVFRSGTLAVEPGMAYAAYLKKKFPWDGVQVVPYDGGVARFLTDPSFAQQCYVTSEPIAAKKQGGDPQVFLIADAGYNPYSTVVVARRALVEQKPEMVSAFVAATAEGWKSYLTDPRPTNLLLARLNPSMDAATMEAAVEAEKPLIATEETQQRGLGAMSAERWATLGQQLTELKLIDRAPSPADLFVSLAARKP